MVERYRTIQRQRAAGELDASGFTLIELLIVIVVLGILAAVVVFALSGVSGQSAQAACNADAKTVATAIAAEQTQNPSVVPTAPAGATGSNLVTGTGMLGGTTYLQSWPNNTGTNYTIGIGATNEVTVTTTTGGVASTVDFSAQTATPATGCFAATAG